MFRGHAASSCIMFWMKRASDRAETGETSATGGVGRRRFLWMALASGGVAAGYSGRKIGSLRVDSVPGLGVQGAAPSETIRELTTPNSHFFVRNHFETPRISEQAWQLEIGGLVSKPLRLSYSDLLLANSVAHPSTLECAGNRPGGAGVGSAVWSGVPLAELLGQARPQSGGTTVALYGADSGDVENQPGTGYARAIPLEKAMDPRTLLAYEMNGEPLLADHGFPLRALVPGWYGMDSVKWLTRIEVLDKPFTGYFQQQEYVSMKANGERSVITAMRVNSKIFRPSEGEEIRQKNYRVEGVAWAGEHKIAKVELATGLGRSWQPANLAVSSGPLVWTPWSFDWQIPASGDYTLKVRASDDDEHTQPEVRDPDRKDVYELNTCHRVTVSVRL
jgi:DMSO/TMAO reductase YedYZ molybdopterin-dependent catalytic subunit